MLDERMIKEADIRPEDLPLFRKARLINAMNDLDEAIVIDIKNIHV